MVFRKENKVDAFQRQISALRQQLGNEGEGVYDETEDMDPTAPPARAIEGAGDYPSRESAEYGYSGGGGGYTGGSALEPVSSAPAMPEIPAMPVTDAQTSVVAHDTTWKGDLQTDGSIHVHGRVEGSIRAAKDVFIAEEADVDATITAANVIAAGLVKGTVRCSNRFEVLPQGKIAGDVQAPTLVVHEGAIVTGQFRMGASETEMPAPVERRPAAVVQRRARSGA